MEWIINRGSKLKNNNPVNIDFNRLNMDLSFIVNLQFSLPINSQGKSLEERVKLENNKYGYWEGLTNK